MDLWRKPWGRPSPSANLKLNSRAWALLEQCSLCQQPGLSVIGNLTMFESTGAFSTVALLGMAQRWKTD